MFPFCIMSHRRLTSYPSSHAAPERTHLMLLWRATSIIQCQKELKSLLTRRVSGPALVSILNKCWYFIPSFALHIPMRSAIVLPWISGLWLLCKIKAWQVMCISSSFSEEDFAICCFDIIAWIWLIWCQPCCKKNSETAIKIIVTTS